MTKGQAYVDSRLVDSPSLFDTLDQAEHGRKQRIIWKVISERSVRTFESVMSSQVDIFLGEILKSAQRDETVDMTPRCQRLAADVICHLGFGYPLRTQTEETNRPLLQACSQVTGRISLYMNWPAISKLLDPLIKVLAHKPSEDFRKSIQKMVEARMALSRMRNMTCTKSRSVKRFLGTRSCSEVSCGQRRSTYHGGCVPSQKTPYYFDMLTLIAGGTTNYRNTHERGIFLSVQMSRGIPQARPRNSDHLLVRPRHPHRARAYKLQISPGRDR